MRVVRVVPYDPNWQEMFEKESLLIRQALGGNCLAVHHIGSTAVPGLAAKPIIDILPVVKNILEVDADAMSRIGYEAKGEYGMPFRRFFQKGSHHVHVFEEGSPEISRHLKFRDWLRTHPEEREAYARLKMELAKKYPGDIFRYCLGKEAFITAIDAKDGYRGQRMVIALTDREREAVFALRREYFQNPQEWSWDEPNHAHLVLYDNAEIAGYAHLQFLPDYALLRVIIIDEPHRYLGLGRQFLHMCERWLTQQGITLLQLHATKEASRFYEKEGYQEMPFEDPDGGETEEGCVALGKRLDMLKRKN